MDGATPVGIRLRRSILEHDAYTVRLADHSFAVLATARPSNVRRWVSTTRWLHGRRLHRGRLVAGLGVQWTPTFRTLDGKTPAPATLQLCVGHRCLVFHLAQAYAIPEALRRFLADQRVTFVGSGSAYDCRILWDHFGLRVSRGRELRAMAGMGNASMEDMADRFLGYPGVSKSWNVAVSAWDAPRLSMDQVEYAAVDAYLAFRLGVHLCLYNDGPEYLGHSEAELDDGEEVLGEDDWYDEDYGYGCDMDDDVEEVLGEDDWDDEDYGYGCDMDDDRDEVRGEDDWYEQDYGCDMDVDGEEVLGEDDWYGQGNGLPYGC
ncbi:hypothetical protein EJB05_40679, partial [Eragrostis curvula]